MMFLCRKLFLLWCVSLLTLGGFSAVADSWPAETVLQIHFLGAKDIAADTNTATLRRIWRLPETRALVAQTLDKLAWWPAAGTTNAASIRLRPLLDDFMTSECYVRLDACTNPPLSWRESRLSLALHLPADRDRLWRTNLAAALSGWTGISPRPTASGWFLPWTNRSGGVQYARSRGWTFVTWGGIARLRESSFETQILGRRKTRTPDPWLEADLRPSRLAALFPAITESFAKVNVALSSLADLHFTESGENGLVHTAATLNFSSPLQITLPPWEIPTNLFHGQLVSFTAARGIAGWLGGVSWWKKSQLAPPPNQVFFWSELGAPFQDYFAAPLPNATNQLAQLSARLSKEFNSTLATNQQGSILWRTNPPAIVWEGAMMFFPFMAPFVFDQHEFLWAGLCAQAVNNFNTPPVEIISYLKDHANSVYYQYETTGQSLEADLFTYQFLSILFHKSVLPAKSNGLAWLVKIAPELADSATAANRSGSRQITISRNAGIGLTATELYFLCDWIESPKFPKGLHTFLGPAEQ